MITIIDDLKNMNQPIPKGILDFHKAPAQMLKKLYPNIFHRDIDREISGTVNGR